MRLSCMIANRRTRSWPASPSRQSASPSRWIAPVAAFQIASTRAAASMGETTARSARSAPARTIPSARPTIGNHHAARPRASRGSTSRPGTGTTVRKRRARMSDEIMGATADTSQDLDGKDRVAACREIDLLGLAVGQAPDQLVAQLGSGDDAIHEHLRDQLVDVHIARVLLALL